VEDLVSTGGSSLRAVEALRSAGVDVLGMVAIFSYGFSVSEDNFRKAGVKLVSLTDYHTLIDSGVKSGYIKPEHIDTLKKWREAPHLWKQ
jgi:orotate phosphoribosyltransferase